MGVACLAPIANEAAPAPPSTLQLVHLAQSTRPLEISASTRQWLAARHHTFRVGVVPNGAPPFDIVDATGSYTGITAELLDRLRSSANLRLTLQSYPDQRSMLEAARRGEIDIAATVLQTTRDVAGLRLSRPYYPDQDSVVERNRSDGFAHIAPPTVKRLAYVPRLVSADVLARNFPESRLVPYDRPAAALTAVAFGQADQYVGNTNVSNYLIERLQLLNLSIRLFTTYHGTPGFQLAGPPSSAPLIDLVNQLVAQIDIEDLAETRSRWEGRPNHVALDLATALSPAEQAWLRAHPVVYFRVDRDSPPFLFHDDKGKIAGVTADMMSLITSQVGLRFEPAPRALPQGATVIAPVFSLGVETSECLSTSPYSWSGFGIVTRAHAAVPPSIGWPDVNQVAIPENAIASIRPMLDTPGRRYATTRTTGEALNAVVDGKADAAIVNINIANYYIAQRYSGKLIVSGYLEPGATAQVGFGVPCSAPLLASIIDKVLHGTREARLNDIRNRWNYTDIPDSAFRPWRRRLWTGLIIAATFGMLLVAWNRSLARQIRLRKQAEASLKQEFQLQKTLLDSMPFPFIICDFQLRLQDWNRAFEAAIGAPRVTAGSSLKALEGQDHNVFGRLTDILDAATTALAPQFKDTRLRVNGHTLDAHAWVVPFVSDTSEKRSLLVGWMDVSERGEMQRAAKRAKEEAESANHAKSTFLATISHEIRTPMNAILGILELKVASAERAAGHKPEDLNAALVSARALISMLDEILDLSKIEAGKLTVDRRPVYLDPITDSVAAIFEEVAKKKGLSFRYVRAAQASQVVTDGARLRQILSNLLSNAIKFTHMGEVSLVASVDDRDSSDVSVVCIEVTDTGIGIDAALIPTLLEPYTQATPDTATRYGGTGLGLPICNALANALGGTLTIDSRVGKGTRATLRFRFPRVDAVSSHDALPAAAPARQDPASSFHGRTAVLVDDHAPNRIVLSQQLQYLGFTSIACELAAEVLDILDRKAVDVLITDCNMPGMNGFELAEAIRQHETSREERKRLTIVGLTASLAPNTLDQAREHGMDACLTKPLALEELAAQLRTLLNVHVESSPQDGRGAKCAPASMPSSIPTLLPPSGVSIFERAAALVPAAEIDMLDALIKACERDIAELDSAIQSREAGTIGAVAHRIHSTAGLCRLPVLADLTDAAESLARSHQPADMPELLSIATTIIDMTRRLAKRATKRVQVLKDTSRA